jgi:amidase
LKPSRGWVPVGPRHDELAGGLDCEHVLARSVRDSALMLDLTGGAEPSSRYLVKRAAGSLAAGLNATLPPLRIGVALRSPDGLAPTEDIGAAVEQAATLLQRAGHTISEFHYPDSASVGEPAGIIWMSAIAEEVDYYRGRVGREPQAEELEALTRAAVALAKRCNAIDYVRARRALSAATGDMAEAFRPIDVLLLPTTATGAVRTGQIDGRTEPFDLQRWNQDSYGYAPFTEVFNVTGQPAISLPLAVSSTGLPIGVQLAAPMGEDARLLTLSAWFEREQPWDGRLSELRGRLLKQP